MELAPTSRPPPRRLLDTVGAALDEEFIDIGERVSAQGHSTRIALP